jgi:hypothetical protein
MTAMRIGLLPIFLQAQLKEKQDFHSAATIQATFRGRKARLDLEEQQLEKQEQEVAAVKIQSAMRGKHARNTVGIMMDDSNHPEPPIDENENSVRISGFTVMMRRSKKGVSSPGLNRGGSSYGLGLSFTAEGVCWVDRVDEASPADDAGERYNQYSGKPTAVRYRFWSDGPRCCCMRHPACWSFVQGLSWAIS